MPITRIARAIDPGAIREGARTALLANSTVSGYVGGVRIYPALAPEGAAAPYVVLGRVSMVYASSYNDPIVNALIDVSAYTEGDSTTVVRALITACLTALIDTPWTIPGLRLVDATMENGDGNLPGGSGGLGFREPPPEVINGVILRGEQFTIRVLAEKVS
jgi:hypothetical protein